MNNQLNISQSSSTSTTSISNNNVEDYELFDEMNLRDDLLHGIYSYGWEKPSQIQKKAIVPITSGRDVIVQAEAGNGKTGAFAIGSLNSIDVTLNEVQILVLSPSRELSKQTCEIYSKIGLRFRNDESSLIVHNFTGGSSVRLDVSDLREKGGHVVTGTPGRIKDLITRRALKLNNLKTIIFDEADVMLSNSFKETIYEIFTCTPQDVQCIIVSATMPYDCLELTRKFMRDPVRILKKSDELSLVAINQFFIGLEEESHKNETVADLYEHLNIECAMIFCNRRATASSLKDFLEKNDFSVSLSHSDLNKEERERVLDEFRSGTTRVLISTNLLGRGIDINRVSLVINYDLPQDIDDYIHRIGRTGRYGKKGTALNLITDKDMSYIKDIEKRFNTEIEELPQDLKL
jgi:translation initiation factor 4A